MKPLLALVLSVPAFAADLALLDAGRSDCQIVVPDMMETPALADCLVQTARLLQTAFKANGADVAVVAESNRDASKPALLLGNTHLAQNNGIDVTGLRDWRGRVCMSLRRPICHFTRDTRKDAGGDSFACVSTPGTQRS